MMVSTAVTKSSFRSGLRRRRPNGLLFRPQREVDPRQPREHQRRAARVLARQQRSRHARQHLQSLRLIATLSPLRKPQERLHVPSCPMSTPTDALKRSDRPTRNPPTPLLLLATAPRPQFTHTYYLPGRHPVPHPPLRQFCSSGPLRSRRPTRTVPPR